MPQLHTLLTFLSALSMLCIMCCNAKLWVNLNAGQVRCWLEDVPADTLISAAYELRHYPIDDHVLDADKAPSGVGAKIWVTDPTGKVVVDKQTGPDYVLLITTLVAGEHKICMQTNSSKWFGPTIKYVCLFF